MIEAAVLGASGYAGGELVRMLDAHPEFEVVVIGAHSQAGRRLGEVHPHLGGGDRLLTNPDLDQVAALDALFLALPHGASAEVGAALAEAPVRIVDLGSDYRMDTASRYRDAYGADHPHPAALPAWSYGLPELFGDDLRDARRVAAPGCYPTGALLALAPFLSAGLVAPEGIVVSSMSGVSGAGRALREDLLFGSVDEGVRAYGVAGHRHRPEIEMGLEALTGLDRVAVTFTPHLVPMQRGILSTCVATAASGVDQEALRVALERFADGRPFVEALVGPPQTRWTVGSNRAFLSVHHDAAAGTVVMLSAIDNLVKGAAGQAVQAANLMFGLSEDLGLPIAGWMP